MAEKEDVFYENINMNTKKASVDDLIHNKKLYFDDVIQNTVLHIQNNKMLDILGMSEMEMCIEILSDLSEKLREMDSLVDNENILNGLQEINDELSSLFKKFGTLCFEQLLCICFGNLHEIATSEPFKYDLLKKYFHPTGYKVVVKREHSKNKKGEEIIDEDTRNLDCFDIYDMHKQFHIKVYGLKVYIYDTKSKKELMIFGTMDDVMIEYLNNEYLKEHLYHIRKNVPKELDNEVFNTFLQFLNLKDLLICKTCTDVYNKFAGCLYQYNNLHQKSISQNIKVFLSEDMYSKRNILMSILMKSNNLENLHLAYLLYDILSNDVNGNVDTEEQTILFDSFTWKMKKLFKKAMKKTIDYATDLSNIDLTKISFEQQICLMKATDVVKEKAISKLREMKSKSEDSGTKPRQYLEGLLKIPFKIYKREPILECMEHSKTMFKQLTKSQENQTKYTTSIEIMNYLNSQTQEKVNEDDVNILKQFLLNMDKTILMQNMKKLNIILKKNGLKKIKIHSSKEILREECNKYIDICSTNNSMLKDTIHIFKIQQDKEVNVDKLNKNMNNIKEYITNVKSTLDDAVYGHDNAKKQIEKIIGQWINGEQDGYCFGFEGPPGVGKTSLAKKGLSNCLKDEKGEGRPFSFIAMGGDSNGSTLHGHNYTYVSSTWGSIVQILMDKKCMNPIIFIDEVDKISRTENGKEIIGILTHLLDPTQNDSFQDKYFAGIDLDLSKALFILSYNDPDAIDSILLDRVHRIKFNSLSVEEKIVICKKHLLPEICLKMGLINVIEFPEETIKFIIDEYTCEAGVRKLKEQLFDIIGEINLRILKRENMDECNQEIPIKIHIKDVQNVYFKDKKPILLRTVSNDSQIGYINGMYATVLGNGGVLPIHAKYFPCDTFLQLKLTGLQQEVMRESMNVALTVAWGLTDASVQRELREKYDKDGNRNGINIHTGDNAVSKDGPSGGCAITIVIYSLLNNFAIKPEIGVTGEIQMSGEVTAIGGLTNKIQGSLKQGVKVFLYPKENKRDFEMFYEKYGTDEKLNGITFHAIEHVSEALDIVIDK